MILVSPGEAALLESPHFAVRPWVNVPGMTFDLSERVVSLSIGASMDNACMTSSVTFARGKGATSLSPFVFASTLLSGADPLLRPNARIEVGFDISADGVSTGAVVSPFSGTIDRVNVAEGDGLITVQCRDQSAIWLDTMIPHAFKAGSDAGTEASLVMAHVLTTTAGHYNIDVSPNLLVNAPPDWVVQTYAQEEMPVLEAMRRIAQQAGRDVRWFRSRGGMVYYDPDRSRTTPDLIIGPTRYEKITELSWGSEDVRNIWDVWYEDVNGVVHGPITAADAESIRRYGPKYSRIYLNRAENIRSDASATAFASAALADTKDPFASHTIQMPLEPRVELNDLHRYLANGDEYDMDQQFAVVAYRHDYRNGHGTTTISARGKPLAAYRAYRRSVAPPTLISTQPPPDDLYAVEGTIWCMTGSLAFPD